jgi:enoyl-CoA hydratase/carnithine racemase
MSEELVLIKKEGDIAILTINRPKAYNSLNTELVGAIGKAYARSRPMMPFDASS